ncbi:MAG: hypothetical protein LBC77_00405, partial [Spirochaetaceae bacterium]|nr:hypothetical protein [Spirochaetaceae bacterium]
MNICAENFFDEQEHRVRRAKLKEYFASFFKGNVCAFDVGYSARTELYISALCEKPIDAYFIHANQQAYNHARVGNFSLKTYLDYIPIYFGFADETLLAKNVPSCIGYDTSGETVVPVYSDDFYTTYQSTYILEKMQTSALGFIKTLTALFGEHIQSFDHAGYYNNILLGRFFNEPKTFDQLLLSCCIFEDRLGEGGIAPITEKWNAVLTRNKQA